MTALARLQRWYQTRCNGAWEQAHGIRIQTLDNPGWLVDIDLGATPLESAPFDRIDGGDPEMHPERPWHECWRDEQAWHAGCSPDRLEEVLAIFLDWAEGRAG